jgi:hypothetical protein
MRCLQGTSKEASVVRFRPLSVRLGVGGPSQLKPKPIASGRGLATLFLAGRQLNNLKSSWRFPLEKTA